MQTEVNKELMDKIMTDWPKQYAHDGFIAGTPKLRQCFCTGACIGPNGERRACNNMQCAPTIT